MGATGVGLDFHPENGYFEVVADSGEQWTDYDDGGRTLLLKVAIAPVYDIEAAIDEYAGVTEGWCGHEHDCCGCRLVSVLHSRTLKVYDEEGNRLWIVTVSLGRNV